MNGERTALSAGPDGSLAPTLRVENGLLGIDPRKISKARDILGAVSDLEAIEVALDLLVLDDAYLVDRLGVSVDDL